ncbi:MAG: carbamoyltransferase family protein, partial [Burkholderiaceae bacterium]
MCKGREGLMYTLGINAAFHDCSACIVSDGVVIAAAEEERFTRIKHGKRPLPFTVWQLPYHAIDYCLKEAGIDLCEVAHVAYSYDPFIQLASHAKDKIIVLPLKPSAHESEWLSPWDPLSLSYIVNAPRQLASGAPHHLKKRFHDVRHDGPYQWHFVEHHLAHEASAFLAAPFDECAVLVMDGRGEQATASYGIYRDGTYRRLKQINYPTSLGLLYEEITDHLGFLRSSDEYKVMALASFGKPTFVSRLREVVDYLGNGEYAMLPVKWSDLFGTPRTRGGPLEQVHMDIAHSLQVVLEETVAKMVDWLHQETGASNLAMAGGVALNCVMNAKIRDRGPYSKVWVQPAAGDSGTSLGAALWIDAQQRKDKVRRWNMDHVFLGPSYDDKEIEQFLQQAKLPYRRLDNIADATAELLTQNKVVGWYQGRMEYGPRSLGARSILASPIDPSM